MQARRWSVSPLVLSIWMVACGSGGERPVPVAPMPDARPAPAQGAQEPETAEAAESGQVRIANPASGACIESGGKEENIETPAGQSGVCVFEDGSRCDSWRLFRKQCAPGQCHAENGVCD